MKGLTWRFWPLVLMGLSHAAAAPDCNTLRLNHFERIEYIDKAEFPNPSKEVSIEIHKVKNPIIVCDLTIENTANLITIKTKKRDTLAFYNKYARLYITYITQWLCHKARWPGG